MSDNNPQVAAKGVGGIQATPDSYQKNYIRFYPNHDSKEWIDIRDFVTNIEYSENINQSSIVCTLDVADAKNFMPFIRISGNERIDIEVSQVPIKKDKSQKTKKFTNTFYVSDVINHSRPNPGTQTFQLKCVSELAYISQLTRINRSFNGSVGKCLEDILKRDLEVDKDYFKVNTETTGVVRGIYPQLKPLKAIEWLMRNSFDSSTPFFFYESLKKGIVFDSLKSLCSEEVLKEYEHKPFHKDNQKTEDAFKDLQKRIQKISSNLGMSKFNAVTRGTYASELLSIDIATKKAETNFYNYKKGQGLLNDNDPFSKTDKTKFLDKTLDEFTGQRKFHLNINTQSYTDEDNYHFAVKDNLQKSESMLNNLNYMTHELTVAGDFDMFPGALVDIFVPLSTNPELKGRSNIKDEMLSGKHLITHVIHKFGPEKYQMELTARKDSSMLDLDSKIEGEWE